MRLLLGSAVAEAVQKKQRTCLGCRHEEQQTAKSSHQNKPGALPHSSLSLSEGRLAIWIGNRPQVANLPYKDKGVGSSGLSGRSCIGPV
jgi:hypothetical protein